MGYEYKCPCGAEFNTPAIHIGRKEAAYLYYRACPFCYKTMLIADEGAKTAKPEPAQKGDSLVHAVLDTNVQARTALMDAPVRDDRLIGTVDPPRFHKRVYEARHGHKCPCNDCAEPDSPMMRRMKWMRGEVKR